MATNKTLVCDTNIFIYFFEGNLKAGEIFSNFNIAVSSISYIELLANNRQTEKEQDIVKDFLRSLSLIETNPFINELAIQFRRSYNFEST